jgi:feruloyl-CoA synthase
LIFPAAAAATSGVVRGRIADALHTLADAAGGSSATVRRAIVLEQPPAIDAQELTDKGSVNQKAVLANRAAIVDRLYQDVPDSEIIEIGGGL